MCGIVALFQRDGKPVDHEEVVAMRDVMAHRGPDDEGVFVQGEVGLGHRRLKIIDLAGGHQPMSNEAGTTRVVFNGEIYNYRELRNLLRSHGVRLRTQSDTETIVGLYDLFGDRCVEHLRGMFAFVLWDTTKQRMLVARDRMGIKPLYVLRRGTTIAFASEIKAFMAMRDWTPEIAEDRIADFLVYRDFAETSTLLRDVERVAPGETWVIDRGGETRFHYWSMPVPAMDDPARRSEDEWVEDLDALMHDVVEEHMISDVPLGTFNSGGLDSSLVTAITAKHAAGRLNTYSVGFTDPAFDESPYANIVAERFETDHHKLIISDREFADLLTDAIWHLDEPLNHPNTVMLLALSKLAKEKVTVVLTGEGADELFGGYPRYRLPRLLDRMRPFTGVIKPLMNISARFRPDGQQARIRAALGDGAGVRVAGLTAFVSPDRVDSLLANGAKASRGGRGGNAHATPPNILPHTLLHDQNTYLQALLTRLDKMAMAVGLEGRVPFLDHRVVELAARIPPSLKIHGMETKYVLKAMGRRHLPNTIIDRRKAGFAVPVSSWLRRGGALGSYVDLLVEPGARSRGYFSERELTRLVDEHRGGTRDNGEVLWALVNLELWMRIVSEATSTKRKGRPNGVTIPASA